MGRDKRNENKVEHFTKLMRPMMQTLAWQALSPCAQALYPWVKLEWRGPKNNNNGKLRLSVRQAAERMGVNKNTAARGYHDLQAKGFLFATEPARLGMGGEAKSPAFELTELEMPNSTDRGGRKLYLDWRGSDFTVARTLANNPNGNNGKTKPCLNNEDSTVLIMRTGRRSPS